MCGAAIGFRARELRLGKPPHFALTGYAWRGHAETVRAKRVRCSLSETKAKTDWSFASSCPAEAFGEGGPCVRKLQQSTNYRSTSDLAMVSPLDHRFGGHRAKGWMGRIPLRRRAINGWTLPKDSLCAKSGAKRRNQEPA